MKRRRNMTRPVLVTVSLVAGLVLVCAYPSYIITRTLFNRHFERWGERLVSLEKRGLLSTEYGAAWQDVLADKAMLEEARHLVSDSVPEERETVTIVEGVRVDDYPSLSVIQKLNEVQEYSNAIEITDRKDRRIAIIRTNHTRGSIEEFPPTLVEALIAAEDRNFRENHLGFEFDSFVRAALRAALRSITTFSPAVPQGTSTITQQVAKLFISDVDTAGHRVVGRTVRRKVRELRLSAALRKMYEPDEILEVYLNHCVTSDYGLIGYKDIAAGLFRKELPELDDAECIYMARMVKWGRNIPGKIARQCRIDMPRMARALGWGREKQQAVLAAIDTLTFHKPRQVDTEYGYLVDCANEFWLKVITDAGGEVRLDEMNIIDPNSLIRRKGNLKIRLAIDLPLQQELVRLVDGRGYGPDTTIVTDVRVGSFGEDVVLDTRPRDTLRQITVLDTVREFSEPGSAFATALEPGDTLVTNIRYRRRGRDEYRRSVFYYARRPTLVDGQYFAYCMLDAKTGKLLAYYARDKIGSRLVSLLSNRTPNGSSTAKPIFHALNFDLGIFEPYAMWTDCTAVTGDVPWRRKIIYQNREPYEVEFAQSAVRGRGYRVHNHGHVFEGCNYVFEHLATSNNILGAELVYRLDRNLNAPASQASRSTFLLKQFFYRIGAFGRIRDELGLKRVTGVRVYKELARIVGVDTDSMTAYGRRVPVSDSLYSVGLGTLELTLYEQAHLFNMLYDNTLVENPARHPSLVIEEIVLNGSPVDVAERDTVKRCHPFADINNLRPVYLGLHKRLTSNTWDGLGGYDMPYTVDSGDVNWRRFDDDAFPVNEPVSNYAKSGTSDDVLRPFNVDVTSEKRTNYGLWNATIRVDMAKFDTSDAPAEVRDITIACIGECNRHYTGHRDGKTLHKFVSRDLLKKAGAQSPGGFYSQYESYIRRTTPADARGCTSDAEKEEEEAFGVKGTLKKLLDKLPFRKDSDAE
ncbi:MAG: hypothetical protein GF418_01330 [Chitinivibrionales bacterium]|nr:hypothetical protein [Chitinivibrionales bacterium]MBD3394244.1 hypothetical protein [Chitinivibrionales bacterium]